MHSNQLANICTKISQQPMSLFQFPLRFLFLYTNPTAYFKMKEIKEVNIRFCPTLTILIIIILFYP